ncbi:tRNA (adenine(58)-N(1))-methyltransferase non-catalytic subunit trm6 [Allomyces javanicus]|nr:tRNA (adenine(58)-N(1))-methyltransferase non-catalytic subunit trm6 [Allomyces javanicus]
MATSAPPAAPTPTATPAVVSESPTTPAEAPAIASKPGIIRAGDHVLLVLPSENKRMLQIKPDATVELGKFGKFQTNALIGKPYGVPYEIVKGGELVRAEVTPEDALGEADSDVKDANNKNIFDDNANQTLTHEEIATLKAEQASGHEIIAKIISSHTDFDKKTEFSKAKYIKKKRQTFLRQFTPVQLDAATLCDFYFNKNPAKTKEMRIDVLSLLLTSANVRAHSRLLIYDDTQGMVTAAVLERMGGFGEVVVVHEALSQNLDIVRYMNFPQATLDTLTTVPVNRAFPLPEEMELWEASADTREIKTKPSFREIRDSILRGGFDGLIVAATADPHSVVDLLSPYIATSRPVVVYHSALNMLTPLYQSMRASQSYILVNLLTTWYRPYQVLPQRTHPTMNMSGHGGALVVATKVTPGPALPSSLTKQELVAVGSSTQGSRKRSKPANPARGSSGSPAPKKAKVGEESADGMEVDPVGAGSS